MDNAQVILETARWIEGRLREDLPVPAIAAKAGYSLHHFTRLFAAVIGMPPKEYVLRRKLSEAARDLAGGMCVTDTAYEWGFGDPDSFSRAFRRELGCSPSAVRRGAPFPYQEPAAGRIPGPPVDAEPVLERFPPVLLAGWQVRITGPGDQVGRLWAGFLPRAASIPRRARPLRLRQLATWTEDAEDWVDILVAAEMETLDALPLDLIGRAAPGCECLSFLHRGSAARVGESYAAIYGTLLPSLDRKPSLPFNFEYYFEDAGDPYSEDFRFKICVPVA